MVYGLGAWLVLLAAMLVVSGGEPAPRDWFMVLAIGAAASIGLLFGFWQRKSRT